MAVDLGSQLITQIRVLGSLTDSDERPQEVVDACLHVEEVMLEMAQQWEIIESYWSSERYQLSQPSSTMEQPPDDPMEARVTRFFTDSEAMLLRMTQMREDLLSASNASMAGELGPLAHQKAGYLIAEVRGEF